MEGAQVNPATRLQEASATLLANIRDGCKTTQKTINCLVAGMNELTDIYLDVLKDKFETALSSKDGFITMESITSILSSLKGQSLFEGLQTKSRIESYMQEVSGGEGVCLQQVVLESKLVLRNGVPRQIPSKFGYTVPFLPQLEQLLNCKDVLECVDHPEPRLEDVYKSVTDGLFYKYHPVVQKNGLQTLAFIIHVDDVEVCDPLKSRANKQNLRLFYWMLGNVNPEKRSSLKAINLLAIVKAKVAKEKGNEPFLQQFIKDMKQLGQEGVELKINGVLRRFYGILLFSSCDNPAAANLGGFKETHFALRPCRMCMVTSSKMCDLFVEVYNLLRQKEEHEKHVKQVMSFKTGTKIALQVMQPMEVDDCEVVESDVADEKYLDHKNPSVNFGVNGKSILSEAPGFDVTKCFPQDFMHLMAEGNVELVCRLLLRDLCFPSQKIGEPKVKPKMSLEYVNRVIEHLSDFGHCSVNKPSRIEKSHVMGNKLKQSASQMLVLMRLLPFIIYNRCDKEKLQLLLKLIHLVDLCLVFELKESDISRLAIAVEDFGSTFKSLYPKVRTLKLHCIVHLLMQARLFGPIRQQWCFRFESMHSVFTSLVPVVHSKKNIALSVASRHLSARNCEIIEGQKSGNYLGEEKIVKSPQCVKISTLAEKHIILEKFFNLSEDSDIFHVKHVIQSNNKWSEGVILVETGQENISFGRIIKVFVINEEITFTYNRLQTDHIPALNAYQILGCGQQVHAITLDELNHKFPILRFSFSLKRGLKSYLLY